MTMLILLNLSTAFWSSLTRSFCWDNFHLRRGWTDSDLHVTAFSSLKSCGWQCYSVAFSHSRISQFLSFGAFCKRGQGVGQPKAALQPITCESVMAGECTKRTCVSRGLWLSQNEGCCQAYSGRVFAVCPYVGNIWGRQSIASGITFSGQDRWCLWICLSCSHLAEKC